MNPKDSVFSAVIFFMYFANIYDMGGVFGLKYLSYLAGGAYLLYYYRSLTLRLEEVWTVFIVFALVPAWALFQGMAQSGQLGEASSQVTPFLPGILMLFLLSKGGWDQALKYFFNLLTALSCLVIILFLLLFLFPQNPLGQFMLSILTEPGHGFFGARGLAGIRIPHVYFKATLFFVAGYTYFLYNGKTLRAALFLVTLVVAFSKAGILLCLLFTFIYILSTARPRARWAVAALTIISIYGLSTWGNAKVVTGYIDTIINAVQGRAKTTQVRIGHWNSFLDLIGDHPEYLLWGQGVGTSYYSDGRKGHVYNIELDHVDAVRQFGMFWFIAFSLICGYVILRLLKSDKAECRALGVAFTSLYLAAGTNPVLITPLFMMLLATLYTKMKHDTPPLLAPAVLTSSAPQELS